jgi:molybdopterin synthase sulfur carrier subunit
VLPSMRSMPVVVLRGPLKQLAGDCSEHSVAGDCVGDLLAEVERAYPAAKGWILDERGILRRHINVFVNGEPGEQDTQVDADDRVDVLPALSGG